MTQRVLRVLYEDNHLIAVDKPCGELVQGDRTGDPTLADRVRTLIKERDRKPGNVFLGVTHRLDRPTSGVVVFAKTSKALSRVNALFRAGQVEKVYWAVVEAVPDPTEGTVTHYLVRDSSRNRSTAYDAPRGRARNATLSWKLLGQSGQHTLLEVRPETGRHHQIRVQLARMGCVIKGDLKYGARSPDPGGGIHLHARSVTFPHPVRRLPLSIVADPPKGDPLWALFPR